MSWIILVLIATLLWAIMSIIHKFVRVEYFENTLGYLVFITPTVFYAAILLFLEPFTILGLKETTMLILTGILIFFGGYFYIEAIHKEEVSRVVILFGVSPLFVLTLSTIFLNEILTIKQYMAFILIFIGSILISFKKIEEKIKLSTGAICVLASAFFFSVHKVILKYISTINITTVMIYRESGYLLAIISLLIFYPKARQYTKKVIRDMNLKKTLLVYSAEIIGMSGMFFSYLALQRGPVSLVSVLEGFEPIFVLILAITISRFIPKILKEEINIKTITIKTISIILMLGGLYMITTT